MSHARAKLQDLFIKESRVEIPTGETDDEGNDIPLVFYVRKMNPLQQERAARKAHAAQVHMRQLVNRPDDPDYSVIAVEVDAIEDKSMFLAEIEVLRDRDKMEQELSDEEEWAKDNYYQSLLDAWDDDMKRDFSENEEGDRKPETQRVWTEMKRFKDILDGRVKTRRTNRAAEIEEWPEEKQFREVFKVLLEQRSNQEWLRMFNTWRMIFGVMDENHERLFENEDDVMSAPGEAQRIFKQALDGLSIPLTDVKS